MKENTSPFAEHLTSAVYNDAIVSLYHASKTDASAKRMIAVRCALELIHAEASSGGENTFRIDTHLNDLSNYADLIQEALGKTS